MAPLFLPPTSNRSRPCGLHPQILCRILHCPHPGPASILSLLDHYTASSLVSLVPSCPLQSAPYTQPEGACEPLSQIKALLAQPSLLVKVKVSLVLSPAPPPLAHSAQTPCCSYNNPAPTLGSLHLQFSWPSSLFPHLSSHLLQISACIPPSQCSLPCPPIGKYNLLSLPMSAFPCLSVMLDLSPRPLLL